MAEANYFKDDCTLNYTAAAAYTAGQVVQASDGRAGVYPVDVASGSLGAMQVEGIYTVAKTANVVILDGGMVWWDHSANAATFRKVNDRDFYLGRAVGDAASADTTMNVAINVNPRSDINLLVDPALSVATGTQALGGFLPPQTYGGALGLTLTATNEAQCVDVLSVDRFALSANAIIDYEIRVAANGSTNAVDLNIGIANGTSTTDADAITESVFFHVDGNSLAINAESDDGTTEVNATDTTVAFTAGSAVANRVHLTIDTRDPSSVKLYVNGVRVLSATTFNIAAATGPLGLLVHLEKSSSTATAGPVYIDRGVARFMEQ